MYNRFPLTLCPRPRSPTNPLAVPRDILLRGREGGEEKKGRVGKGKRQKMERSYREGFGPTKISAWRTLGPIRIILARKCPSWIDAT